MRCSVLFKSTSNFNWALINILDLVCLIYVVLQNVAPCILEPLNFAHRSSPLPNFLSFFVKSPDGGATAIV